MTILHRRGMSKDGALDVEKQISANATGNKACREDSDFITLTADSNGNKFDGADVSKTTSKHGISTSLWENIESVRASGKVFIDGSSLDIASVIAVAK